MTAAVLASIPSPSKNLLEIGPLTIHAYGVMIALGVIAGIWLSGRRLEAARAGTREVMGTIGLWGVVGGIVGARAYYVITDPSDPWKRPSQWLKVWEGGLGIPGGLLLGVLVAGWVARRKGVAPAAVFTAAAPAIPLAQAIGRWGNWFNQELFGRPTSLPWALEIDYDNLPRANGVPLYEPGTTFHPTFLYESLWNLALCGVLLLLDRRRPMRAGSLLAVYVGGYSVGRFLVENLRIDPANTGGGLRLNQWIALVAFVASMLYLIVDSRRPVVAATPAAPADTDTDTDTDTAPAANGDPE